MIRRVTSTDNRIYKLCASLAMKKYRDKEGKYLIEGENLLDEAIKNKADIVAIILREDIAMLLEKPQAGDGPECKPLPCGMQGISSLITQGETRRGGMPEVYAMPSKLFDKLAQAVTSQGILAVVSKPGNAKETLINANTPRSNLLILDRLQDLGNIGTVIRTADAAGYLGIIAMKGTGDIYAPKVIRAAAGSVFRIPIIYVENNRELQQFARDLDKRLVATAFDTKHFYYEEDLTAGIGLIIGNEGNGISDELMELADVKVKIPMKGNIESLNAAVAAGIIMYEAMRKEN